jgi:hypothetical protein
MKNEMKNEKNCEKVVIRKEIGEFLGLAKIGRLSAANWYSRYLSILNSKVISILFVTKEVIFRLTKVVENSLSKKRQLKMYELQKFHKEFAYLAKSERGDVPGWVLVVLMTTGLVTGIWTVAQPRLSSILKNSLDNMNSIR